MDEVPGSRLLSKSDSPLMSCSGVVRGKESFGEVSGDNCPSTEERWVQTDLCGVGTKWEVTVGVLCLNDFASLMRYPDPPRIRNSVSLSQEPGSRDSSG